MKLTLPPRVRLRWLLMTTRLSIISLAGMARTLVAVGTSSEAFMFLTTAAAAPRSTCVSSPSAGRWDAAFAGLAGAAFAEAAFAGLPWPAAAGVGRGASRRGRGGCRRGAAAGARRAAGGCRADRWRAVLSVVGSGE